ncbi:hypothetical protein EXIGLDRAFT_732643 [Exidia glandulosa HHB12029]|uniref:Uncharacterized protein n=1 Tax=Exidia glandulosa HHB12029 TaxID=1314781 RepID=A0A165KNA9_EXIGL|nr:hypothetical protein EXIGLDRAFT_732643 [Exidia glandulosa HHB12029]
MTWQIQLILFLSILAGVGSVFVGMFYVWQHQIHVESSGVIGAGYLRRTESIPGSTYTFSLLLALPLVLLLWSLIAFVLSVVLLVGGFKTAPDGSPGAIAQRVVSSVGVVLFICVVVALASFWRIWHHQLLGAGAPSESPNQLGRTRSGLGNVYTTTPVALEPV